MPLGRGRAERQEDVAAWQQWELRLGWPGSLQCLPAAVCARVTNRISYPHVHNPNLTDRQNSTHSGTWKTEANCVWEIKDEKLVTVLNSTELRHSNMKPVSTSICVFQFFRSIDVSSGQKKDLEPYLYLPLVGLS